MGLPGPGCKNRVADTCTQDFYEMPGRDRCPTTQHGSSLGRTDSHSHALLSVFFEAWILMTTMIRLFDDCLNHGKLYRGHTILVNWEFYTICGKCIDTFKGQCHKSSFTDLPLWILPFRIKKKTYNFTRPGSMV